MASTNSYIYSSFHSCTVGAKASHSGKDAALGCCLFRLLQRTTASCSALGFCGGNCMARFILQDVLLVWCFFIIRCSVWVISGNILEGMCALPGGTWLKFIFVPFQVSSRLLHPKNLLHFSFYKVTKHFEGRFEAAPTLCYTINFSTGHLCFDWHMTGDLWFPIL